MNSSTSGRACPQRLTDNAPVPHRLANQTTVVRNDTLETVGYYRPSLRDFRRPRVSRQLREQMQHEVMPHHSTPYPAGNPLAASFGRRNALGPEIPRSRPRRCLRKEGLRGGPAEVQPERVSGSGGRLWLGMAINEKDSFRSLSHASPYELSTCGIPHWWKPIATHLAASN